MRYSFLMVLSLVIYMPSVSWAVVDSATKKRPLSANVQKSELSGVALPKVFSAKAKDFYQGFVQIWQNEYGNGLHSVIVEEQLSAKSGNRIKIHGDRGVFYFGGVNRRGNNWLTGQDAARQVIRRLKSLSPNRSNDPDLAEDEF